LHLCKTLISITKLLRDLYLPMAIAREGLLCRQKHGAGRHQAHRLPVPGLMPAAFFAKGLKRGGNRPGCHQPEIHGMKVFNRPCPR